MLPLLSNNKIERFINSLLYHPPSMKTEEEIKKLWDDKHIRRCTELIGLSNHYLIVHNSKPESERENFLNNLFCYIHNSPLFDSTPSIISVDSDSSLGLISYKDNNPLKTLAGRLYDFMQTYPKRKRLNDIFKGTKDEFIEQSIKKKGTNFLVESINDICASIPQTLCFGINLPDLLIHQSEDTDSEGIDKIITMYEFMNSLTSRRMDFYAIFGLKSGYALELTFDYPKLKTDLIAQYLLE